MHGITVHTKPMTRFLPDCHTHIVLLFVLRQHLTQDRPTIEFTRVPQTFHTHSIHTGNSHVCEIHYDDQISTSLSHSHRPAVYLRQNSTQDRLRIDPRSSLPKYFRSSTIRTLSTPEMVTSARSTTMTRFLPGEQVADTDMSPTPRRRRPAQLAFMGSLPQSQGST